MRKDRTAIERRLAFCRKYRDYTVDKWKRVLFSDESTFRQFNNVSTSLDVHLVWIRTIHDSLARRWSTYRSLRYGDASLMLVAVVYSSYPKGRWWTRNCTKQFWMINCPLGWHKMGKMSSNTIQHLLKKQSLSVNGFRKHVSRTLIGQAIRPI